MYLPTCSVHIELLMMDTFDIRNMQSLLRCNKTPAELHHAGFFKTNLEVFLAVSFPILAFFFMYSLFSWYLRTLFLVPCCCTSRYASFFSLVALSRSLSNYSFLCLETCLPMNICYLLYGTFTCITFLYCFPATARELFQTLLVFSHTYLSCYHFVIWIYRISLSTLPLFSLSGIRVLILAITR